MRDEWKRTIRTVVQIAIGVASVTPLLIPALGLSATVGVGAGIAAVAATVTRLSQIPQVAELLNKYLRIPKP